MLVFTFLLLPQRPTLLHLDEPCEAQQKHSHGLYRVVESDTKATIAVPTSPLNHSYQLPDYPSLLDT